MDPAETPIPDGCESKRLGSECRKVSDVDDRNHGNVETKRCKDQKTKRRRRTNQEALERKIEELSFLLAEERQNSHQEQQAVVRLQKEIIARQKAEKLTKEDLMKELERERMLRIDAEQRLREMTIESDSCRTRLQALQEKFKSMEEMVRSMLQYKNKIDQLKQEKCSLSATFETNLHKYRTHVSSLERENMMLLNEVKKLECQLGGRSNDRDRTKLFLERLKMLEAENSALVLENEQQRQQYEKCLDEIANQVVQALLVQKTLREECSKLQCRVHDLEIQNQQLNVMFQRRIRFASDSLLQNLERDEQFRRLANIKRMKHNTKKNILDVDIEYELGVISQCPVHHSCLMKDEDAQAEDMYFGSFLQEASADSLQSICSDYCYEEGPGMPQMSSPPPWLRDRLNSHADLASINTESTDSPSSPEISQEFHPTQSGIVYSTKIETEFPATNTSPKVRRVHVIERSSKAQEQRPQNPRSKVFATVKPMSSISSKPSQNFKTLSPHHYVVCRSGFENNAGTVGMKSLPAKVKCEPQKLHHKTCGCLHESQPSCHYYECTDEEFDPHIGSQQLTVASAMSLNDILENSLDALETPVEDSFNVEIFPVFRADNFRTETEPAMGISSGRTESKDEVQTCSQLDSISHIDELSHTCSTMQTIPRPNSLNLANQKSTQTSCEDSQTSPMSPYMINQCQRTFEDLPNCDNLTLDYHCKRTAQCCKQLPENKSVCVPCTQRSPLYNHCSTNFSLHTSPMVIDSKESHNGSSQNFFDTKKTVTKDYFTSLNLSAAQVCCTGVAQKSLPLFCSDTSKFSNSPYNNNQLFSTATNHDKATVAPPISLDRKTLTEMCTSKNKKQKTAVSSSCSSESMKDLETDSDQKKGCSISSDSSFESIRVERSGSKDDGYSTMSSDMQPEMLEKFSDAAFLKKEHCHLGDSLGFYRNSSKLLTGQLLSCAKTYPSSSPTDSEASTEHSSDTTEKRNSQEKSLNLCSSAESLQPGRVKQLQNFFENKAHLHDGVDKTHTFPKIRCPSKSRKLRNISSLHDPIKTSLISIDHTPQKPSFFSDPLSPPLQVCSKQEREYLCSPISSYSSNESRLLLSQAVSPNEGAHSNTYCCLTFPQKHKQLNTAHIKRAMSDSQLVVRNRSKAAFSVGGTTFSEMLASGKCGDRVLSASELSVCQAASMPLTTGSLRRTPWQLLTDMEQTDSLELVSPSRHGRNLDLYGSDSSEEEVNYVNKMDARLKPARALPLWTPYETARAAKNEMIKSPLASRSIDDASNAEEWLLRFSKEDIETNLAAAFHKQKCCTNESCGQMSECTREKKESDSLVQRNMPPKDSHHTCGGYYEEDAGYADAVEVEEQTKFRSEFYSLCRIESNRSLFSGSSYDGENECCCPHGPQANNNNDDDIEARLDCNEMTVAEFEQISQKIVCLSKTVSDLHKSFSSLNSVEYSSDVGGDLSNPSGLTHPNESNLLEGYHWVEDEFYLTPYSGEVIVTSSPLSDSVMCYDWMNEYIEENSEEFELADDLKESCDDDQRFLEELCAVANKGDDEDEKDFGAKEKLCTPEYEDIEDILVANPRTRAELLDAMVDVSEGSDESSDEEQQVSLQRIRNKQGRHRVVRCQATGRPMVDFRRFFTRFGESEQEAVSAFDFLDQFSISSTNSEPTLSETTMEDGEFFHHCDRSDSSASTASNRSKGASIHRGLSKKALKQIENCNKSNLAKVAINENSFSNGSFDSPEEVSASTLSLSDSCCETYSSNMTVNVCDSIF